MDHGRKPRHIREIAHLYISRLPNKKVSARKRVLVTAVDRGCFPGFHVANLAVGLARKRWDVYVFELSGVMPCSGYFLAMPPRVYVKQKREFPRDPVAAVDGVTLTFSGPADEGRRAGWNTMVDGEGGRDGVIDLIHTPPVCELDAFAAAVEALAEPGGPAENVVLLAGDAEGAGAAWKKIQPIVGMGAGKHTILLGKRRRENAQYPTTLANWRRSLSDRLPCVIRDPNSHLSQSYLGICNTIITSRGNHAPAALSRTAAAQTR